MILNSAKIFLIQLIYITMFSVKATSALACFIVHVGLLHLFWSNWNLEILVFLERGEKEFPEKFKPSEQNKNQQQSQPTSGTRSESHPGHTVVRQALTPLHHPCSPVKRRNQS